MFPVPVSRRPLRAVAAMLALALPLATACDASNSTDSGRRNIDLSISQVVSVDEPPELGATSFRLTVRNEGPVAVEDVIAGDTLSTGLTFLLHDNVTKGTYDPATRIWTIGDLAVDEEASMTIYARAAAGTDGSQQTNTAGVVSVSESFNDSVPDNNITEATVSVSGELPPTAFQNEPPGFTALTNNLWTQHTGNGWTYTGADPSGNFTRVVTSGYGDPPPVGGPSVLEAVYAANSQGGSGPGRTGFSLAQPRDEIFVGMWHKYSADYPASPVFGGNKMFFMLVGQTSRSYLVFRERAQDTPTRSYDLALDDFEPLEGVNSSPPTLVPYGQWYKMEWYMRRNTPGQANGVARFWMNGTLLIERTDLTFPGAITAVYLEGTNNGAAGALIPRDGRWWMAQTYISVPQ